MTHADVEAGTKRSQTEDGGHPGLAKAKRAFEFIFAAALAVYGVLGYYVFRGQWRVMQDQTGVMQLQARELQAQLDDARKAAAENDAAVQRQFRIAESQAASMKQLADANKIIAESARRSADSNTDIARSAGRTADAQQRAVKLEYGAWVWFDGVEIVQLDGVKKIVTRYPDPHRITTLRFILLNSGRTPAADVTVDDVRFQARGALSVPVPGFLKQIETIEAGQTAKELATLGIVPANSGTFASMHVTANLSWKDVYGERHRTQGCYDSKSTLDGTVFVTCQSNNTVVGSGPG